MKKPSPSEKISDVRTELADAEAAAADFAARLDPDDARRKKLAEHEDYKRTRDRGDMQKVLSSVEGRRIIFRLLEIARPYAASFNPDELVMAFNEGRRDIGLKVLEMVNAADPESYPRMLREHASDAQNEAKRLREILHG